MTKTFCDICHDEIAPGLCGGSVNAQPDVQIRFNVARGQRSGDVCNDCYTRIESSIIDATTSLIEKGGD